MSPHLTSPDQDRFPARVMISPLGVGQFRPLKVLVDLPQLGGVLVVEDDEALGPFHAKLAHGFKAVPAGRHGIDGIEVVALGVDRDRCLKADVLDRRFKPLNVQGVERPQTRPLLDVLKTNERRLHVRRPPSGTLPPQAPPDATSTPGSGAREAWR